MTWDMRPRDGTQQDRVDWDADDKSISARKWIGMLLPVFNILRFLVYISPPFPFDPESEARNQEPALPVLVRPIRGDTRPTRKH
jgi:hypothetical protein